MVSVSCPKCDKIFLKSANMVYIDASTNIYDVAVLRESPFIFEIKCSRCKLFSTVWEGEVNNA